MKPEGMELQSVATNDTVNKPLGSKSFGSEDCESTSSEYRRNPVKSLPNLRGLGKKKKREETENKSRMDVCTTEDKAIKNRICDEEHSEVTVGQNVLMKICDTDTYVISKSQAESQKSCTHRTSKISRSFPSVIRRKGPQKKHLLCKKFHGDASDEREGGDWSTNPISGGQIRYKTERNSQKLPPQPLLQSFNNNPPEAYTTSLKSARIRNMLNRKNQKIPYRDTCKRPR